MRTATLKRDETGDQGTFGTLVTDSGFTCRTGELPWRDNLPDRSCIPPGVYTCAWGDSPKHGECYHVQEVPKRSNVEIHAANWMGDQSKGYKCELMGCIAPGMSVGELLGQKAILQSVRALGDLVDDLDSDTFELTIVDIQTG